MSFLLSLIWAIPLHKPQPSPHHLTPTYMWAPHFYRLLPPTLSAHRFPTEGTSASSLAHLHPTCLPLPQPKADYYLLNKKLWPTGIPPLGNNKQHFLCTWTLVACLLRRPRCTRHLISVVSPSPPISGANRSSPKVSWQAEHLTMKGIKIWIQCV